MSGDYHQTRYRAPDGATSILLIRHGATAPSREGELFPMLDGRGDPGLGEEGRQQAIRLAERLRDERFDALYVTKLRRTRETAAPLLESLRIEPRVAADLHEVGLGDWEGGVFRIRMAHGDPLFERIYREERWDVIPGAEPLDAFDARLREGFAGIVAAHPGQRVALVTHGGVITHLLHQLTGSSRFTFADPDNASISEVVVTDRGTVLRRFNDIAHLEPLPSEGRRT